MIANYDAKAIADVMGIGFLCGNVDAAEPVSATKPQRHQARGTRAGADFVFQLDGGAVLMVQAKTNHAMARFSPAAGRTEPYFDLKDGTVSVPSPRLIEKAVERGLPRQALRHVAEALAGGDRTKVAALEWGLVPKTTLERRETQLSPQESERTERVARLLVHARRALGTDAEAREFMTTPHPRLDGRSPVDTARTDIGTRRAEQLLNALEYGLAL